MHNFLGTSPPRRAAGSRASAFATVEELDADHGASVHRVVIVGGGAGGVHLAALLGRTAGRAGAAEIVLIDRSLTHVWKPLLHEVAAGTLPVQWNESSFLQLARRHHFRFHLGDMDGLDRSKRRVWLQRLVDVDGEEIAPRRALAYDTLVIAVGSIVDDFGIPGVAEHASRLDSADEAEHFHRRLLAACARAEIRNRPVEVVIVGGGATGVELAAELHEAVRKIARYGAMLRRMPAPVRLTLIERAERLLGGLPAQVSLRARQALEERGVTVVLDKEVTRVEAGSVTLGDGTSTRADLSVWAAGIKAQSVLARLDGLAVNRRSQLHVTAQLQTTADPDVFAFGDCAVFEGRPTPPTAQAAQQQAEYLACALRRRLAGKPVQPFRYRDRGALVSLGSRQAAGTVPTTVGGRSVELYGTFARLAYWAIQRKHLATLHGFVRAALALLANWLASRAAPRVKLH